MTAHIRCLCSRCAGDIVYARLSDYLEAHPEVVEAERSASKGRHPSKASRLLTFLDGSQTDGDLVRSSSGDVWRQLRLDQQPGWDA